ncbi:MAG: hypothetical protein HOI45_03665 [Rhodospirillaceae bacterium]|jgi:hypothetical protein|nr:hypothetical protein [Rhodospirillaceae bacterium]
MSDDPQVTRQYQSMKSLVEIKGFKFAQEFAALVHKHRASAAVVDLNPSLAGAYEGGDLRKVRTPEQ